MDQEKLLRRVAELETVNDQLQAEIRYLDEILRRVGFINGLQTLKDATVELLEDEAIDD